MTLREALDLGRLAEQGKAYDTPRATLLKAQDRIWASAKAHTYMSLIRALGDAAEIASH